MCTSRELRSIASRVLPELLQGYVEVRSVLLYRSVKRIEGSGDPICTASVVYDGPPPSPSLPAAVSLCKATGAVLSVEHAAPASTRGDQCMMICASSQPPPSTPPGTAAVQTLYCKVYSMEDSLGGGGGVGRDSTELSLMLAVLMEINTPAAERIALMSYVSASKHARVHNVHLTEFLVECNTVDDAEVVHRELNESKGTVKGKTYLVSMEYTYDRQGGEGKAPVAKPLLVPRELRGAGEAEWPQEAQSARIAIAAQVAAARRAWCESQELLPWSTSPEAACTPCAQLVPPPPPGNPQQGEVLDFPSEPPALSAPSIEQLISTALSTISSTVDLPWEQRTAVMMGAAAYAVVSGHWSPTGITDAHHPLTRAESEANLRCLVDKLGLFNSPSSPNAPPPPPPPPPPPSHDILQGLSSQPARQPAPAFVTPPLALSEQPYCLQASHAKQAGSYSLPYKRQRY